MGDFNKITVTNVLFTLISPEGVQVTYPIKCIEGMSYNESTKLCAIAIKNVTLARDGYEIEQQDYLNLLYSWQTYLAKSDPTYFKDDCI